MSLKIETLISMAMKMPTNMAVVVMVRNRLDTSSVDSRVKLSRKCLLYDSLKILIKAWKPLFASARLRNKALVNSINKRG